LENLGQYVTNFVLLFLQAAENPSNTIFEFKRLLGKNYNDSNIQENVKYWPFVVKNVDNKPKIQIVVQGKTTLYAPEEITSIFFTELKSMVETFTKATVKDVTIIISPCANNAQRQATLHAANIAGLSGHLCNETTSVALAYGLKGDHLVSSLRTRSKNIMAEP
jgi:heat shock 70kDa protein 1/2/6/8